MKIGSWSVVDMCRQLQKVANRSRPASTDLVEASRQLHLDFDSDGPHVVKQRNALKQGARIVRLAHQPNLFPYDQLLAQTVFLWLLSETCKSELGPIVPMVFVVDYDVRGDKRIRSSQTFDQSMTRNQVRQIFHATPKHERELPCYLTPAPEGAALLELRRQVAALAHATGEDPQYILTESGLCREHKSLSDFNLYSWINLVVNLWELPILFVRLSDLLAHSEEQRMELADKLSFSLNLKRSDLLWNYCRTCRKRIRYASSCCASPEKFDHTIPRVMVDTLSDYYIWDVIGGTSYLPSKEHMLDTFLVSQYLHLPFGYETCWKINSDLLEASEIYKQAKTSQARSLIASGRNSLLSRLVNSESKKHGLNEVINIVEDNTY